MQKITPFLWYNDNAQEAMNFYLSIFKNGKVVHVGDQTVSFELEGQRFIGLNGGPVFTFSPAVSFLVNCETQAEVDDFWERLSDGGEQGRCGWLKDKFGLSWQIVPSILPEMLDDDDPVKAQSVIDAMMQMNKLDIAALKRAYNQGKV